MGVPRQLDLLSPEVAFVPTMGAPLAVEDGALVLDPYRERAGRVFVQVDAPAALARELARREIAALRIGVRCEPYQEAERHFRVVRRLLETLDASAREGLSILLT